MENGHANENGHGLVNGNANTVHMDYSTDFPSLPISVANDATSSKDSAWSRPRPMQSKNSTLTFVVPPNERASTKKNLLGNQPSEEHKRCAGVAAATGCRIELSESKDGSLTVIIKGPRGKIEEAKNRVVRDLQTQDTFKLPIPKDHHRKIIGKEGSNLKNLELATGCQIKIPKRENASDVIEITGPVEGIKSAVEQIKRISDEEARNAVENIVCPRILYPFIKGADNEIYNKLTNDHGVKINIPPSHVTNEIINIQGTKEGVHAAATVIRKIIHDKENTVKPLVIQVPKAQHRHIVGQARKGLQDIFRETGCWVEVPEQEEQSDNITLRGDPAKLGEALAHVYARASSIITQSLECPIWLRRYIIGEKGSKLNELVPNRDNKDAKDRVRIDFDENGHIYFEGSPAEVKAAYTTLDNEVNRLKKEKAREVLKIHPDLHRHIIGNQGSNLKKIKGDNDDLYISFPNKQKELNSDEVTVEGPKNEVARVVKEIQTLVTKHENEKTKDLVVEQRFHKNLIGTKGENIQKIREKYPAVTIAFPDQNKNSDIIQIRGDRKDVDAVAALLTKDVKDLKESSYQESVPIFKDCHKHIIGKGGERINKIRDATNTKIMLPSGSSGEEKIVVQGKKENVAKAVAELIKIQQEQANITTIDLDIPTKVQARLLGGGRRLIQDIETECGSVHIKFPAEKSESTKVTIRGHKDDVEKAEKLLSALAKDKEQNLVEDTVSAKAEFHRFLIGKKGEKIKSFRGDYDVRIMFPRETDSDKETIHLLGKKEDVAKVKKALEQEIQTLSETVTAEIDIEKRHHKTFLRSFLKDIQEHFAVTISLPHINSDATRVTIKGFQSGVDAAKEKIDEVIQDLENSVEVEVEIPKKHYGLLLGTKREAVKEIESTHNVSIKFPARDSTEEIVKFFGRDTKIEAARAALNALLPVDRKIRASNEVHRMLKANKGAIVIKMSTDHSVNIRIPREDSGIEEITVSGAEADVDAVLAAIQEMESHFYELRLDVPLEYHWKIQGDNKMKNFRALHHKYGVTIYLPPKENPGDFLTLQGPEDQTKACAEEILATVEEMRKLFTQEISLDHRYHRRMMGGYERKNLAKLEKQYKVEIMVPGRPTDPDLVLVAGQNEDDVFNCIEHLKDEEEDYVRGLDRAAFSTQRMFQNAAAAPAAGAGGHHNSGHVVINNAPWQMDVADFPEMGAAAAAAPSQSVGGAWGGPRRW